MKTGRIIRRKKPAPTFHEQAVSHLRDAAKRMKAQYQENLEAGKGQEVIFPSWAFDNTMRTHRIRNAALSILGRTEDGKGMKIDILSLSDLIQYVADLME